MNELSEWLTPTSTWFLVGVGLFIVELMLPSLVLFFFGLGAWAVSLSIVLGVPPDDLGTQFLIFSLISILSFVILRDRLKSIFYGDSNASEEHVDDDFVGQQVLVLSDISPTADGRVELHGSQWKAVSDETLSEGQLAEVVEKNNLTLKVKSR